MYQFVPDIVIQFTTLLFPKADLLFFGINLTCARFNISYVAGLGSKQCTSTSLTVSRSLFNALFESLHTPPSRSILILSSDAIDRIAPTSVFGFIFVPGDNVSKKSAEVYPLLHPISNIKNGCCCC